MLNRILQLASYSPDKEIHNYRFSLKAVLGKGSYGTVYLAFNKIN